MALLEVGRPVGPVRLRCSDGTLLPLLVDRWLEEPDRVELAVLDRAVPPVLDVGCGPGRMALAAAERGWPSLGVEIAPSAVRLGRSRGAAILERSIFDPIPATGRWGTAMLLDGTIGIGGAPHRVLRRMRSLLRPSGHLLAEVEPPGLGLLSVSARVEAGGESSPWFPWARVGADGIRPLARSTGFTVSSVWREGERWFAELESTR